MECGLLLEKATEKGACDLLVALTLLTLAGEDDLAEIDETYARLGVPPAEPRKGQVVLVTTALG